MLAVRALLIVAAIQGAAVLPLPAGRATTLQEVMRRAHAYVAVYEDHELSSLIAREHYHQQLLGSSQQLLGSNAEVKMERRLVSDYLIFQVPPNEDWFGLRDVQEVDGAPVADRVDPVKRLFEGPRDEVETRAMEIDKESARFNLGEVPRTINLPTFALRFLRPVNRKRFDFDKEGEQRVGEELTWIVRYRETKSPTFTVTTGGRDVEARGRFWIDPQTGAVARSEMILGGIRSLPSRVTVTVTYGRVPSLTFRVPIEMRERYDNPRQKREDVIVALATYSDFRPFDLRTLK